MSAATDLPLEATTAAGDAQRESALDEITLRAQMVRLLYGNLDLGVKLGAAAALLVLFAAWLTGPLPTSLKWWAGINFAWIAMGYVLGRVYKASAPSDHEMDRWARQSAIGCAIAGTIWGAIGFCLLDPGARPLEPVFLAIICAMSIGVYTGYACYLPAMYGFVGGLTLTFSAALTMLGGLMQITTAVLLVMAAIYAVSSGRNLNRLLRDEIILRHRNARLVEQLTAKQREVETANRAKTRFLAAASHDLRQPVHAINLYGEVLRDHVATEPGRETLRSMSQAIQALDGLFESIEDIAKFEAGIVAPKLSVFPLRRLFTLLRAEFDGLARAKDLRLSIQDTVVAVHSDLNLLQRILGNLLSNAIRYTDSGSISLEVLPGPRIVTLRVVDTGIGMERRQLQEIFGEFVQLHNPERDRRAGLGLGLSIVKRLADLLNHPVTVDSTPGQGSTFTVAVPLAESPVDDAIETARPSRQDQSLAGRFILVIDDDDEVLRATTLLLQRWRCHVLAASSGQEASERLRQEQRFPDVIVSDYRLRGTESGPNVIARLRTELQVDIPALLVTGDIETTRLREAYDDKLQLLHKPLAPAALKSALLALMATPTP